MHPSLHQPGRSTRLAALALVFAVLIASFPAAVARNADTQRYVGHRGRLSAQIPAGWVVPADGSADYRGDGGFVFSSVVEGSDLLSACANVASARLIGTRAPRMSTWSGAPACRMDGEFHGQNGSGIVIPLPTPVGVFWQDYLFVVLVADPVHFASILDTLSFDPAKVSPRDYAYSVLDIMEARAWFSPEVDWDRVRQDDLGLIANAQTYEETHWIIRDALNSLRAWGDNHSYFSPDDSRFTDTERSGTGMQVQGKTVLLVYPDSPAGRADIRVGDTIETVKGDGYNGIPWIEEAVGTGATLEITRPGVTEPIVVHIKPGPYTTYLPPMVGPMGTGVGYVELFSTIGADPVKYVTDANDGIAHISDAETCGWIVDLRRNGGGSYSPMVMGVVPMLGDGPLFSFERRDGVVVERIEFREGRIYRNGDQEVTGYLGDVPVAGLNSLNPPVAVLIGPGTGSAAEVTAVAFIGRPDTRLFGETSAGATIGNSGYSLFDGSRLGLAESTYVDRTGGTHIGGIEPDVTVATEWASYGTENDPVIMAASDWLREQPGCGTATPVS